MAWIFWVFPVLAALCFGQPPAHHSKVAVSKRALAQRPLVLPALPAGPLPQVPMAQLPSVPPQVSYQNGMLTIVAQNSSLGDILREVHKATGASIDVPANATDRVVVKLGPAPARDVLTSLLNGSGFNYVMVGSASDASKVTSVVLTTKPAGGTGTGAAVASAYQPPQQYAPPERAQISAGAMPGGQVVQQQPNADEDADAEDKDDEESADEDQAQEPPANGMTPVLDGSDANAGPKTPEQILEMLRQRQQGPGGQVRPQAVPQPNQPPQPPQDENQN